MRTKAGRSIGSSPGPGPREPTPHTSRATVGPGGPSACGSRRPSSPPTWRAVRRPSCANRCRARHLNIAHGIYPRDPLPAPVLDALAAWLRRGVGVAEGRTYAGGLTKFEPGELERIPIPPLEHLGRRTEDSRREAVDHRQAGRVRNRQVRVVVDVEAAAPAVAEVIAGKLARDTQKAGCRPDLSA